MNYTYTKPIEMPRGSQYGSDYWITYSSKINRQVHLYSMLEYANFLILELNSNVEYFCEQPVKISWPEDGKEHHSIFDFWIYYTDGTTEFQEVKYSEELSSENSNDKSAQRSLAQIKRQQQWCNANNQSYRVVTENDIYKGPHYINNLKIMQHKIARYKCIDEALYRELLCKYLEKSPFCSIHTLIAADILPNGQEIEFLSLAYQQGIIDMNIKERPLDYSTEVHRCENENIIY